MLVLLSLCKGWNHKRGSDTMALSTAKVHLCTDPNNVMPWKEKKLRNKVHGFLHGTVHRSLYFASKNFASKQAAYFMPASLMAANGVTEPFTTFKISVRASSVPKRHSGAPSFLLMTFMSILACACDFHWLSIHAYCLPVQNWYPSTHLAAKSEELPFLALEEHVLAASACRLQSALLRDAVHRERRMNNMLELNHNWNLQGNVHVYRILPCRSMAWWYYA